MAEFLSNHLPWGNIVDAWVEGDEASGLSVAFKVEGRSIRHCDLEAFLVLLLLTMWGGHLYFDNVTRRERGRSGAEKVLLYPRLGPGVRGAGQIYFQRVIANATRGQVVRLPNHKDLRMQSLQVVAGPSWECSREEALRAAVSLYREAVAKGDVTPPIFDPEGLEYEAVVRHAYQLLDGTHGPVAGATPITPTKGA